MEKPAKEIRKAASRVKNAPSALQFLVLTIFGVFVVAVLFYRNRDNEFLKEDVEVQVYFHTERYVLWGSGAVLMLGASVIGVYLWFRKAVPTYRRTKGKKAIQSSSEGLAEGISELLEGDEDFKPSPEAHEKDDVATASPYPMKREPSAIFEQADDMLLADDERSCLISAFSGVPEEVFGKLGKCIHWIHTKRHESLFEVGDSNESGTYLVVRGRVGAYRRQSDPDALHSASEHLFNKFEKGNVIGHDVMFTDAPRSFAARTLTDCDMIRIPRDTMRQLAREHPEVVVSFIKTTLARPYRSATFALFDFFGLPAPQSSLKLASRSNQTQMPPVTPLAQDTRSSTSDSPMPSRVNTPSVTEQKMFGDGSSPATVTAVPSSVAAPRSPSADSAGSSSPDVFLLKQIDVASAQSPRIGGHRCVDENFAGFFAEDSEEIMQLHGDQYEKVLLGAGKTLQSLYMSQPTAQPRRIYVLLSGNMALYSEDEDGADDINISLPPGSVIDALCFFTSLPAKLTARAITECELAILTSREIDYNPDPLVLQIAAAVAGVMIPVISLFIDRGFQCSTKRAGATLYSRGDPTKNIHLLVYGRVRVYANDVTRAAHYLEIGKGECVGEMAMLSGHTHHLSTVVCARDTELVKLGRNAFNVLQEQYPQVLRQVTRFIAQRFMNDKRNEPQSGGVSQVLSRSKRKVSTIALIFSDEDNGPDDVRPHEFGAKLQQSLEAYGKVAYLNQQSVNNYVEEKLTDTVSQFYRSKIAQLMGEQESTHDFVIMEAMVGSSAWSKSCVRQADLVFLVRSPSQNPAVSQAENDLLWNMETGVQNTSVIQLVLVHPDDTVLPSGTRDWLRERQLHSHHHVRRNLLTDYDRLARSLTGTTCGLVLGGGGSRGLAHQGIIKALEEHKVPIDYIGGTSQGSFMAAVYALHQSSKGMEPSVRGMSAKLGNVWELIGDATFPLMSYFSGCKFNKNLKSLLDPAIRIEDLWIPYFCVTTNVSQADVSVHRTGVLWKAVRSSMTILDYLPPMWIDGDMYIDGGYINNLPVDIMKEIYNPELVVAVDVENKDETLKNIYNYGEHLSGTWLFFMRLWGWLNPFAKQMNLPPFGKIVGSMSYMNHNRNIRRFLNEKMMDVYIRPELGDTKLLDYHKHDQICQIGYKYGYQRMMEWKLRHGHRYAVSTMHSARRLTQSRSFAGSGNENLERSSSVGPNHPARGSFSMANSSNVARKLRGASLAGMKSFAGNLKSLVHRKGRRSSLSDVEDLPMSPGSTPPNLSRHTSPPASSGYSA